MADKLTPQQYTAVHNRGGKLLVSAAAGSGKTKVLVDRLLSYLQDPNSPVNVDDFLIITYTKAAASELRGKIAAALTKAIADAPTNIHLQRQVQRLYLAKISTVHAFCADILREYAYRLDIAADFRVADENECVELQHKILNQILENAYACAEENPDFRAFIDTQGLGRDDRQIPQIILQVYQSARCHLNPEKWLDWCTSAENADAVQDAGQTVWGKYLISDLHSYLDLQIDALNRCAEKASITDGMEKASALLASTVAQLSTLRNCATWNAITEHGKIDYGRLLFPKNCTDLAFAEQIKAVRNACKKGLDNKLRSFSDNSDQVLRDLQISGAAARGLIALVRQFAVAYDNLKHRRRILDFGDLEHKTLDLLLGKNRNTATAIAQEIGDRFHEIMVDEYQDSNAVQDAIFTALTQKRNNCFMVGDVKQSIYQFRLAEPGIFIEKYNSYVSAEAAKPNQGRKVLLSSNFRSSGGVIEAVNHVFATCMSAEVGGLDYGEEEMLREGIPHCILDEPEVELHGVFVQEDTYAEEASFVAEQISGLLDGTHMVRDGDNLRPIVPGDIVILLRSPGSVGGEFRYALECRGIPCTTGDSTDLLQTEEICVLRSLLQIISNPMQDIPLIAVLTSPVFGFTADELADLRSKNRRCDIFSLLQQSKAEKVLHFLETLSVLRKEAKQCRLTQLLERILSYTRLDTLYAARPDGKEKIDNIQMFCQLAASFESVGYKDLEQFLTHLEMLQERGFKGASEATLSDAVTIMSIHKSKGLEFPVVFVCGLSRGFNQESARGQVLCHKELGLGLSCVDMKQRVRYPTIAKRAIARKMMTEAVSEEMRVLYVAMTRARDRLIMTYADKSLDATLQDIALRMDYTDPRLLTGNVNCPGEWVLMAALKRIEAGAFFHLSGHTPNRRLHKPIWSVQIADGTVNASLELPENCRDSLPKEWIRPIEESLAFSYAHSAATKVPSKQTATQLKGRFKDQESAENTDELRNVNKSFRKPSFAVKEHHGQVYGNAIHAIMQYIRYENCVDIDGVQQEVKRLVAERLITEEQGKLADCDKIARLFSTELGKKLQSGCEVLREFKFSVLEDAGVYYPDVTGEQVLLQGVVDCAIIEDDGITVVDFKTDYVTEETLSARASQYRPQVMAYARALSRIYKMSIKAILLYFFHANCFVNVENPDEN